MISVVIPTHNCRDFLSESIESVLAQSVKIRQIIVVDDQSVDGTVEFLAQKYPQCVVLKTAVGNAAKARNVGVEHAIGEWVAFLDADDVWRPDHVEQLTGVLTNSDVAAFALYNQLIDGKIVRPERHDSEPFPSGGGRTTEDMIKRMQLPNCGWPTSGMLVQRDRFVAAGGFDVSQKRRHDTEMFFRICLGHSWGFVYDETWNYRIRRKGNISSNSMECSWYWLQALSKMNALYPSDELVHLLNRQRRLAAGLTVRSGDREAIGSFSLQFRSDLSPIWKAALRLSEIAPKLVAGALQWRDNRGTNDPAA